MVEHFHCAMDRQIFNMQLSIEATSAYIVVASLTGENLRPTLEYIQARWTSTPEALEAALNELMGRHILEQVVGSHGEPLYYPAPSSLLRSSTFSTRRPCCDSLGKGLLTADYKLIPLPVSIGRRRKFYVRGAMVEAGGPEWG